MRKLYIALLINFFSFSFSQSLDLAVLANGENVQFNAFFEPKTEKLMGYFTLYDHGKINETTKKFEYIILDQNLNKVMSKEFEAEKSISKFVAYTNINGNLTLSPRVSEQEFAFTGYRSFVFPDAKEINLKENIIYKKQKFCYENNAFTSCPENKSYRDSRKDDKKERKEKGFVYNSEVIETKIGGFLVVDYEDYDKYVKNNRLIYFDKDKKEIWRYEYNKNAEKKKYEYLRIIDFDEEKATSILTKVNNEHSQFDLLVIDMKTGKVLNQQPLEKAFEKLSPKTSAEYTLKYITSFRSHIGDIDNDKTIDNKIYLLGRNYQKEVLSYYDFKGTGYTRLVIDKNTYEVSAEHIIFTDDVSKYITKIDNNGYVEKGYYLAPRDLFFLKDGKIGILTEKYKDEGEWNAQKTSDFIYLYTDKDFKLKGVKTINKEVSRYDTSDYLFSQYINNENDVVFFYNDYVKKDEEKFWNLYVNTLIDEKFNQETFPISSKKNMIIPYVAKQGYILLREFNEKEKYNKIRLEKLNY